jgi:hypothetical protein
VQPALATPAAVAHGIPGRLVVRATLIAAAAAAAGIGWLALAARAAADAQEPNAFPVGTLGTSMNTSLALVATSLTLGAGAGIVLAAVGALAERSRTGLPWLTWLVRLSGRLLRTPWVLLSPALLPVFVVFALAAQDRVGAARTVIATGGVPTSAVALLVLAGAPAILVAGATLDPLRQGWSAALPGFVLAALGRGLVAIASVLTMVQTVFGLPVLKMTGGVPRVDAGQVIDLLVVIAIAGFVLILAGDAVRQLAPAAGAGRLARPARSALLSRPQRAWLGCALALSAALPVAVLGAARAQDVGPTGIQSSVQLLPQTLLGSMATAVQVALVAALVGGAWGAIAGLVARRGPGGDGAADLLLAPAWLLALVPLLPAVALVAAPGRLAERALQLPLPQALDLLLLCRVALVVRELRVWRDLRPVALLQGAGGVFLVSLGVAFVAAAGFDTLALGQSADVFQVPLWAGAHDPALRLALVTAGAWAMACLAAGRALLGPVHREQDWFRLEA